MRRRTMIACGLAAATGGTAARAAPVGTTPLATMPVVLELFTSQGCSSCPPADALLGELARQPDVIGLAWHVDYWNRLGWPDPFANRQWSDRQRAYARRLGAEVYTPALVVNGAMMVVGSNRRSVGAAMQAAPVLTVAASLRRTGTQLVAEVDALPAGASLSLAVYDPEHTTIIGAGENGGRRLRDFQVVRELRALEPAQGRIMLPGISADQGAVLLVHGSSGQLAGAAEVRTGRVQ